MSDISWLKPDSIEFPDVESAAIEPDGLLAVGGDLTSSRLITAYRQGIFPWYEEGQPILWWSPDPRCVLFPEKLHVSKSLRKTLKRQSFRITYDQSFEQVLHRCAGFRKNSQGTWITPEIKSAYTSLHLLGIAHSVEAWRDDELVGGLYGLAMGSVFFGESMFSSNRDASKVALYCLVEKLTRLNFTLIDCQVYNPHLESLGAECIPRRTFIDHLHRNIVDPTLSNWHMTTA